MFNWEIHGRYYSKAEALLDGASITHDNPNYHHRVFYGARTLSSRPPWILEVCKVGNG